jgi:hypothetical protein
MLPGQQHIAMDTAPDLFVREVLAFSSQASLIKTLVTTQA